MAIPIQRKRAATKITSDMPGLDDTDNDDDDPDANSGGDDDDLSAEDTEQQADSGNNDTGYETNSPTAGPLDSPTPSNRFQSTGTHTPSPSVLLDPFAPVSDTPTTSVIHPPGTANEGSTANSTTRATLSETYVCALGTNASPVDKAPFQSFDNYFKSLTDAQKEPFKKEQRTAQATTRKAKVAAKKANSVPNAN
ncbi:hypothetical protein BJY52DRAFT_1196261 [Lactarius psammicola]|nr:hypothetical protein BJY52DRAFT_1196261 [Lactarius psammicola]